MKQATADVLDNALATVADIDKQIAIMNFFNKSEAYLELEADPFYVGRQAVKEQLQLNDIAAKNYPEKQIDNRMSRTQPHSSYVYDVKYMHKCLKCRWLFDDLPDGVPFDTLAWEYWEERDHHAQFPALSMDVFWDEIDPTKEDLFL